MNATLLQIRSGRARVYPGAEPWSSAIAKDPVLGEVSISLSGVADDEQADRVNHGGPDKAILCYPREHYAFWSQELAAAAPLPGTLGENFESTGAAEEDVCVGDIIQVGGILVQISQPRQPCWKPARLHNLPLLTARILKSGRTGWYLRVLQPGPLAAPEPLLLVDRPHPQWTVARATRVRHFETDPAPRVELASLAALSEVWRSAVRGR